MTNRRYYVYILASRSRVLYVGVTNDLARRLTEHRSGTGSEFTRRYRVDRLVYVEMSETAGDAIRREKQVKGWSRAKKEDLIASTNPDWGDLALLGELPESAAN